MQTASLHRLNQRPSSWLADTERAALLSRLTALVSIAVPLSVMRGAYSLTHRYLEARREANRLLLAQAPSISELRSAVNTLERF